MITKMTDSNNEIDNNGDDDNDDNIITIMMIISTNINDATTNDNNNDNDSENDDDSVSNEGNSHIHVSMCLTARVNLICNILTYISENNLCFNLTRNCNKTRIITALFAVLLYFGSMWSICSCSPGFLRWHYSNTLFPIT